MTVVGTWNLENLFRPGTEFGPSSEAIFNRKVKLLAQTVGDFDVDVLGVQEVGSESAFDALIEELGAGWTGVLSTHFEPKRPIRVGFLSRVPIEATSEQHEIPVELRTAPISDDGRPLETMGRGALHMRVQHGGQPLDLAVAHLKSKLLTFPGRAPNTTSFTPRDEAQRARYGVYALIRRAAEAAALRQFADELLDGRGTERRVIVLGDLNDEMRAATTQIIQGPPGSEIGSRGERRPDTGDAWRLLNIAPLILPEEARFSRIFEGRPELIDHLLVSKAVRPLIRSATTVIATAQLPSVTMDANERRDDPASDHSMVLAELDT
jgi:endonuclease/exonuclease/phosphatase family metal-dependent hydrolase